MAWGLVLAAVGVLALKGTLLHTARLPLRRCLDLGGRSPAAAGRKEAGQGRG